MYHPSQNYQNGITLISHRDIPQMFAYIEGYKIKIKASAEIFLRTYYYLIVIVSTK